jgi:hypothetical protein
MFPVHSNAAFPAKAFAETIRNKVIAIFFINFSVHLSNVLNPWLAPLFFVYLRNRCEDFKITQPALMVTVMA